LSLGGILANIDLERDYAAKVTRTYYLAQDVIRERLGISPEPNETHSEYCERVSKAATYLAEPLHEIVALFELASYGATGIGEDRCREAVSALTKLFQEVENRTKGTQPYEALTADDGPQPKPASLSKAHH
jgi:hypothetical protein